MTIALPASAPVDNSLPRKRPTVGMRHRALWKTRFRGSASLGVPFSPARGSAGTAGGTADGVAEEGDAPTPIKHLFVLVGGWPGSGKTTLAGALATQMKLPLLAKDNIKEALADALGQPADVAQSQRLGRAAVQVMLRVAHTCPGAVMDSTWFPEVRPLVMRLPGGLVEVRCVLPQEVARTRYYRRAAARHEGHLDLLRTEEELWGSPSVPLGVGPVVQVDTTGAVDMAQLMAEVLGTASTTPRASRDHD